jgi:hypothetical protein
MAYSTTSNSKKHTSPNNVNMSGIDAAQTTPRDADGTRCGVPPDSREPNPSSIT